MPNQMKEFLQAMRRLEEVRTPLNREILTEDTALDSSQQKFDPNREEQKRMGFDRKACAA